MESLENAKNLLLNTKGAKKEYEIMVDGAIKKLVEKGVLHTKELERQVRRKVIEMLYYTALVYNNKN